MGLVGSCHRYITFQLIQQCAEFWNWVARFFPFVPDPSLPPAFADEVLTVALLSVSYGPIASELSPSTGLTTARLKCWDPLPSFSCSS